MSAPNRDTLGPFIHAICFQYLRLTTEEVAGRAPLIAAGRKRGFDVVESLDLLNHSQDPAVILKKLQPVFGAEGTRLCLIDSIGVQPNGGYEVRIRESACTMGMRSDEPMCAFTLGVFIGALSAISGQRMIGREVACQACGVPQCIYMIDPV